MLTTITKLFRLVFYAEAAASMHEARQERKFSRGNRRAAIAYRNAVKPPPLPRRPQPVLPPNSPGPLPQSFPVSSTLPKGVVRYKMADKVKMHRSARIIDVQYSHADGCVCIYAIADTANPLETRHFTSSISGQAFVGPVERAKYLGLVQISVGGQWQSVCYFETTALLAKTLAAAATP